MSPKILASLWLLVVFSIITLIGLYNQTKQDIQRNYARYISSQGSWEPLLLTEEEFFERLAIKGLDDAQAAIRSISQGEVRICQEPVCERLKEILPFTYYPNPSLEQEILESYLSELNYTPLELDEITGKLRENYLPSERNFFTETYGRLEILADDKDYYLSFLPNEFGESESFRFRSDFFDRLIADLKIHTDRESEAYENVLELERQRSSILATFILGFSYKIPKDTFQDVNRMRAFFIKFHELSNRGQVQDRYIWINNYNDLLAGRVNIEKLNQTLSNIFIKSLYAQIFEKPGILSELDEEEEGLDEEE